MSGASCASCVSWIGGSQHVPGAAPHLAPNVVRVMCVLRVLDRLGLFAADTQDIFHGSGREWRLCSQRNMLPPPKMSMGVEAPPCSTVASSGSAPRHNSLMPEAVDPKTPVPALPHVHVQLTRQHCFAHALMQAAHGVARCLTIACQGLQEQHNEHLSEDRLLADYTLGRHFTNSMRVPM